MKNFLLMFVIATLSLNSWGAAWTSTNTGGSTDFNTNNTWGGSGHPVQGDTFTVAAGTTVVCNTTCAAGLSTAGAGSADCVVAGGTFTVAAGATMDCFGLFNYQHASTVNVLSTCGSVGQLNIDVPNAGTYLFQMVTGGAGSSTLNFTGVAPSGQRCDVIIKCVQTGTGTCEYTGTAANVVENWSHFEFQNFGSASVAAISLSPGTVQDLNWTDGLFINTGSIAETRTSATVNIIVNGLTIINPLVTSNFIVFTDGTAQTGGSRSFNKIFIYSDGTVVPQLNFNVKSAIVGQSIEAGDASDVTGIACYNCGLNSIVANSSGARFNNSMIITDNTTSTNNSVLPDNGETFWNYITLGIQANYHVLGSSGASAGGAATVVNHHICDGDGTAQNDFGDMEFPVGTWTIKRSVNVNNCGTTYSAVNTTVTAAKILNSTMYRSQGASVCELACSAGSMAEFHNNLMIWPLDQIGGNFNTGAYGAGDGLHFNGAYLSAALQQTWGANTMGSNNYFMMPNSGDVLNGNAAQVNTGADGSNANTIAAPYVNTIKSTTGGLTGVVHVASTAGTDTTHIFCSTCNFTTAAVQAGSEVIGFTGAPNPRSYVTTVNSATEVTLGIAIPGMTSGTSFTIGPSVYSNASFFLGDTNNLQNDVHTNPSMRDPDKATTCNWLKSNSITVHCGTGTAGITYNSTSGPWTLSSVSGTTVVNCTTCDFVTWNIQVGEPIIIYNGNGTTARGRGTVSVVNSATQLTITSIAAIAASDHLLFLDVTRGAGRALLTQANYDQTGAYTNALSWATPMNLRQYIDWRITPMNSMLKNASFTSNCTADSTLCDMGAVPVFPAAILSSN